MTFSRARLLGHRHGRDLERDELAARAGIPDATLATYESAYADPPSAHILALASALDVPVEELDRPTPGVWHEEYIAAVVQHLDPLTPEDVAAVSTILARSH